jgi:hypothetical protein
MMYNPNLIKEGIKFLILSSQVGLHSKDFSIEQSSNKRLEFLKLVKNFRFIFQQIDPSKFTIVINKAHIIFI